MKRKVLNRCQLLTSKENVCDKPLINSSQNNTLGGWKPRGHRDYARIRHSSLLRGLQRDAPCCGPWALHAVIVPEDWGEKECVVPLNLGRAETCRLKLGARRRKEKGGRERIRLWWSIAGEHGKFFPHPKHSLLGESQCKLISPLLHIFFKFIYVSFFFFWDKNYVEEKKNQLLEMERWFWHPFFLKILYCKLRHEQIAQGQKSDIKR